MRALLLIPRRRPSLLEEDYEEDVLEQQIETLEAHTAHSQSNSRPHSHTSSCYSIEIGSINNYENKLPDSSVNLDKNFDRRSTSATSDNRSTSTTSDIRSTSTTSDKRSTSTRSEIRSTSTTSDVRSHSSHVSGSENENFYDEEEIEYIHDSHIHYFVDDDGNITLDDALLELRDTNPDEDEFSAFTPKIEENPPENEKSVSPSTASKSGWNFSQNFKNFVDLCVERSLYYYFPAFIIFRSKNTPQCFDSFECFLF
jgi:hypothetical protein